MLNILNNRISEEYGIVSSYWETDEFYSTIVIQLSDGYKTRIELHPSDTSVAYATIERELTNYYLLKNRKDKIKKITNKNNYEKSIDS